MEKAGSGNIYIGLGANLPHPRHGSPKATLEAALADLEGRGLQILRLSPWYRTAPVPTSDQPWFVNAVAELASDWPADRLLAFSLTGHVIGVPVGLQVPDLALAVDGRVGDHGHPVIDRVDSLGHRTSHRGCGR